MKIYYRHYRYPRELKDVLPSSGNGPAPPRYFRSAPPFKPLERGGKTVCIILDEETGVETVGVSHCSLSDQFNYERGRRIAHGRAVAMLALGS